MKKLLIYYNFIIISLMVVVGFVSATNYLQLVAATLFFPIFCYFVVKVIPRKSRAIHLPKEIAAIETPLDDKGNETGEVVKLKKEGVDVDRRAFLKLIGTAGVSLFLFSLFTKKAEAAFFGSVPGPGTVSIKNTAGVKIDPAEATPTDGYKISELDDSTTTYFGFTKNEGSWFIMREDEAGAFRYIKGSSDFATNWTNRESLTYDYYTNIF